MMIFPASLHLSLSLTLLFRLQSRVSFSCSHLVSGVGGTVCGVGLSEALFDADLAFTAVAALDFLVGRFLLTAMRRSQDVT